MPRLGVSSNSSQRNDHMTSPTFNLVRQAFALIWESNALSFGKETGTAADLTTSMQNHLKDFLGQKATQEAIGQWSVVWGPAVFQDTSVNPQNVAPDNVMYVAA